MRQVRFDLLTRKAIGLTSFDEVPFCEATLFNFQKKLLAHAVSTGSHLIEQIFDGLTAKQLETLKIKTDLQRCDSLQVESNIRSYSRIQLLIEVLLRLYRIMSDDDKKQFGSLFAPYAGKTSGQYIYKVEQDKFDKELEQLAEAYRALCETVKSTYGETDIARIFARVFEEHFTSVDSKIVVKSSEELHSGCLQSPDDEEATYRKKRGVGYRGLLTATETCNPENEVQLITDIHVTANNRDENDEKMKDLGIEQIQTAIKGRESAVDIVITKSQDGLYEVHCPHQSAEVCQGRKRLKATFDGKVCESCPMRDVCPSIVRKSCHVVYFDDQDVLRQKRQRNIQGLPVERRGLRANVEATMREFSRRTEGGKLKVRGIFKAQMFALTTAIGINFGRVYRHAQN